MLTQNKKISTGNFEDKIKIKHTEVTKAEPPLANTEKTGYVMELIFLFIPRLSCPCLIATGNVKFASPEKKATTAGQRLAYKTFNGCDPGHKKYIATG